MNNQELFEESKRVLVGGVNSPVRAIEPYPFIVERGEGARLYDVEGKSYVDYCLAFGPLILGHNNPIIRMAVEERLANAWCFGTPTEAELKYAKLITSTVPNVDKIRCLNTGTEATMTAIRLARGFTGRDKIIKIEGAFHGAHDAVLVKAGSGALTHSVPNSKGIPTDVTKNTILIPYNDVEAIEKALKDNEGQIAAMITEPAIGNAGCILPKENYLRDAKSLLESHGSLLILDEVITGFRLGLGGAQDYFAGTFNGHPISISAGIATLELIKSTDVLNKIANAGNALQNGLKDILERRDLNYQVQGLGPMFQVYFNDNPVTNLDEAKESKDKLFLDYCTKLRELGVYLPPSQFECCFTSVAHDQEVIDFSLTQFETALIAVHQ
jgi:glutamate-1-semialdehyde 2,1-aminomutase